MTLTAKQREVIERMARGGGLATGYGEYRNEAKVFCSQLAPETVRPKTMLEFLYAGLIEQFDQIEGHGHYRLTELGRAAARGEA